MNKKWDIDDNELAKKCIDEIIARISEEDDTEIGMIAAQDIIEIVTENLAPVYYNKGVKDAGKLLQDKLQDLELDLDVLKQH